MHLIKDQHRAQPNRALSRPSNINPHRLRLLQERIPLRTIKRNERSLSLAPQILKLPRIFHRQLLNTRIQVIARLGGVLNQVKTLNLINDATEQDCARWVAHPGVELAVRLVRAQRGVAVVVTCRLCLLGERHHVRWRGEVPVLVSPELASSADTGLYLVNDEEDVVLGSELAQAAEEGRGSVVIATLGLDGLDDDGSGWVGEGSDEALDVSECVSLSLCILGSVLLERVFEEREGGLGPVEGGDVELVDGLGAGGGEGAEEAAVEGGFEGEDGEVRGAGEGVVHAGGELLGGEFDVGAAAALLGFVHECGFEGALVGVGAGGGGEDLVEAFGCNAEDAGLEDLSPVVGGEVAECGAVDEGVDHLGGLGGFGEGWVVVTDWDGGNLSIAMND